MARRWRLVHADGREWTRDELAEVIRVDREHDGTWPYDAVLFDVAVGERAVYLLDNCMAWHAVPLCADGASDDMAVVWDD